MYYLHGSWKFIFLVAFKTSMSLILVTCIILQSLDYSNTKPFTVTLDPQL
jgi:hypothetical protein